jgi:hypothetical protein
VVIRHNTLEGTFNGIACLSAGFDRHAAAEWDVYENTIRRIADDAFEPEGTATHWRIWRNRVEDVCVVLSVGPLHYGPVSLVENTAWRIGPHGTGRTNDGRTGASGKAIKYSGQSSPTGLVSLVRNTLWTDVPNVSGAEQTAGGGPAPEAFYLRDTIFRFTRHAFEGPSGFRWDADGNVFATTDLTRGASTGGVRLPTTDVAWLDAQLEDPAQGKLAVRSGSPLAGKGATP